MLVIRRAQWDRLADVADEALADRLAEIARLHWPAAAALTPEARRERVKGALARGRRAGFVADRHAGCFVMLDFALGAGFEQERDWARAILGEEGTRPAERLQRLLTRARGELG
ncbi:hypothetical protein WME79_47645 [Sorangium sp. So ce726]|uniref:hypothetical protein n=1 Tax=Sorangium sp. So ce726 TaxID=3133319 RepID=UPI003F5F88B4